MSIAWFFGLECSIQAENHHEILSNAWYARALTALNKFFQGQTRLGGRAEPHFVGDQRPLPRGQRLGDPFFPSSAASAPLPRGRRLGAPFFPIVGGQRDPLAMAGVELPHGHGCRDPPAMANVELPSSFPGSSSSSVSNKGKQ
jgi:hypothetical protein